MSDSNIDRRTILSATLAWAAATLLILFVFVTSLTARWLLSRARRRLEGGGGGDPGMMSRVWNRAFVGDVEPVDL